ncbi:MAG TPA: hypothetical protein DCL34_01515 [Erythrobacter sp.]|jgi:hypothetical protein|nr:hypothetical protein IT881_06820 [Erythrobacter sp. A30-3]HAG35482.1 hypothetical protein [Erythrobacter sp.]|tara:strand:+ start:1291 stop:1638 length:348 start_codon:yes stop_codon:yes gene_type:complete
MESAIVQDAVRIREQLRESEAQSDELLLGTAELMKRMIAARRNPSVKPHAGQVALMRLASAQRKLIASANDIFRVHDELSQLAIETGVADEDGTTPKRPSAVDTVERELKISLEA